MTYEELQKSNLILFHGIRGSRLFGLDTSKSDTDTEQIFCSPQDWILGTGLWYEPYISDEKNNNSASELGKFIRELGKSNPNALFTLWTPPELTLYKSHLLDPLFDTRDSFITKECFKSFKGYAKSQIGKAKGLYKAMNIDPIEVEIRKTPLDFSWVLGTQKTLKEWLTENNLSQEYCGISKIPKRIEMYYLYYDWGKDPGMTQEIFERFNPNGNLEEKKEIGYRGILNDSESTQLRYSSIPKEEVNNFICSFQFNNNSFSSHCKQYKNYWNWVKNRNPERYGENYGFSYDAKNCCHCIRILRMATEIARGDGIILDRRETGDRDFLLDIKTHKYSYQEVMTFIQDEEDKMIKEFSKSNLPDSLNIEDLERTLIGIRKDFWKT